MSAMTLCGCPEPHTWDFTTPCVGPAASTKDALAAALSRAHAVKNDPTSVEEDGNGVHLREGATLYTLDPPDFELYIDLLTALSCVWCDQAAEPTSDRDADPVDDLPPDTPEHVRQAFADRDIGAVLSHLAATWSTCTDCRTAKRFCTQHEPEGPSA